MIPYKLITQLIEVLALILLLVAVCYMDFKLLKDQSVEIDSLELDS